MLTTTPARFPLRHTPQTLLLDADDTLWENNIYFERAIASFISLLDHQVHTPAEVREHLNTVERATIAAHGYGLRSFEQSLITCFEDLSQNATGPSHHGVIAGFARAIAEHEIEVLPAVAETLAELAARHRLLLVTKGNNAEQRDKLARSGLEHFFAGVEVLAEKHPAAYRELAHRHECEPERTWMIGNSPRSDINPALAAGLHAIFIPHSNTWVLEHETLDPAPASQHLIELAGFRELLTLF